MLSLDALGTMALFAEVVERRSFTAAARTAGLAKATVSRRIAMLERDLGVRLLQRTTRQVVPTAEGRRLYEQSARVVAAAKEATQAMEEVAGRPRGVLRVGAPVCFAQMHLAPAIADFLRRFPEVDLELLATNQPVDLVAGEVDVSIRVGKPRGATTIARRLAWDQVVVVAAPAYLAEREAPQTWADLGRHTCLRYSWETTAAKWRLPTRRRTEVRGSLISTDAAALRQASLHGLGLAVLPSYVVAAEVAAGRLERVLATTRLPKLPISVIYPERRSMPARVRAFVDFVVSRFATRRWARTAVLHGPAR